MRNRLSLLMAGTVLAVASGTAAARGDVSFGISIGVPVAPAPVYVAPPPVVYAPPPPVVYYPPARVYYAPAYYGPPAAVVRYRYHRHRHHW